jgi:hypothetical protein
MAVELEVTEIGRHGLDLDGWGDLSVWGWDSQAGTLFAQLWHDRSDDDEDEDEDNERPDIWIAPPAWEATGQPTVLAEWIAEATGSPLVAVLWAMAASLPGPGW